MNRHDDDLWFFAKAHNRRVSLIYFAEDDLFIWCTKTLISFEKRLIAETSIKLSPETFTIIVDLINMIRESPQYKTSANRAFGRLEKHGPISVATNFREVLNG